jgi:hypothetical protein
MKNLANILLFSVLIASCTKQGELPPSDYSFGGGVFILNEGTFRAGNGSLSFYSYDSTKIFNDLFYNVNGRHLGDVPNSMIIYSDKAYIVVNNSGKIEVIDQATLESKGTITGLISPRNMALINDNKAYVTSLYSDSVAIINLTSNSISGWINLKKTSESITIVGINAYISNWVGGNKVMVVNTLNDHVTDSIEVGNEPESMTLDGRKRLWVLCNGGWNRHSVAELVVINTSTKSVEKTYSFPTLQNSPTCIKTDGLGMNIFYIDKGVMQMSIDAEDLPFSPIIPESGASFYKIAVNPINSDIFVTDAVDYVQRGYVSLYKNNGKFVAKEKADIIPGAMCFKLRIDTHTN